MAEFDPEEIFAVFDRHGVRYVLIGGMAAALHGADHVTTDVDVSPAIDTANLERLAAALRDLDARIRVEGEPDGVPFDAAADLLARAQILNLTTRAGDLDISTLPSGTQGYDDLRRDAVTVEIHGTPVTVASLADVIRSKEAAGRARDLAVLPLLRRLLEEQGGPLGSPA